MTDRYLYNFKDGVVDGLIHGTQNEKSPKPDGYKHGYDFGLTLWDEHEELIEKEHYYDNASIL